MLALAVAVQDGDTALYCDDESVSSVRGLASIVNNLTVMRNITLAVYQAEDAEGAYSEEKDEDYSPSDTSSTDDDDDDGELAPEVEESAEDVAALQDEMDTSD